MATSQQQWRRGSQFFLLAAASALVLLIGSADAKCVTGYADCDGIKHNGCETNVYNDPYNCGYCHYVCKTYPHTLTTCENGECTWVCTGLYGDCDGKIENGCEKDLNTDPNNCGYCHNKCKLSRDYKHGEAYCSAGECYSRCPAGWKYNSSGIDGSSGCAEFENHFQGGAGCIIFDRAATTSLPVDSWKS